MTVHIPMCVCVCVCVCATRQLDDSFDEEVVPVAWKHPHPKGGIRAVTVRLPHVTGDTGLAPTGHTHTQP